MAKEEGIHHKASPGAFVDMHSTPQCTQRGRSNCIGKNLDPRSPPPTRPPITTIPMHDAASDAEGRWEFAGGGVGPLSNGGRWSGEAFVQTLRAAVQDAQVS